jgi:internalin A
LCGCAGITDLSPIAELKNLESLSLLGCPGITDLSPLAGLDQLAYLSIGCLGVTDLLPIARLPKLGRLELDGGIADLAQLAGCDNLEKLELNLKNMAGTMDGLAQLNGLYHLDIENCPNLKMETVASLASLVNMLLDGIGVISLSTCSSMTRLNRIDVTGFDRICGVLSLPVGSVLSYRLSSGVSGYLHRSVLAET